MLRVLPLTQACRSPRHKYVTGSLLGSGQHFQLPEGHLRLPQEPCKADMSRLTQRPLLKHPRPQAPPPSHLSFPGDQALSNSAPQLHFSSSWPLARVTAVPLSSFHLFPGVVL